MQIIEIDARLKAEAVWFPPARLLWTSIAGIGPPEHDRTGMRAEDSATVHSQVLGPGQGHFDQRLLIHCQEELPRRSLPEIAVTFPIRPAFPRLVTIFDLHQSVGDVAVSIHAQGEVVQSLT